MCYYIHGPIRNSKPCSKALRCRVFSFADPGMTCQSPFNVSSTLRRCIFGFSHIANFQPKFYVGSTSSFVLDREHSRYRKFLQVQQHKFVLAEVALRFWCRFDNFWMWSVFPIYTNKSNFWALEQALIQLWQPRLNTPFIYQFFNCRKGLIARTKFSASRQFGAFSLWRKLRWRSTPHHV